MEQLHTLVTQATAGGLAAYGEIVRRFQDMAYGYAYAILGDFHLAEDAAQEAFVEAYGQLAQLRTPEAFPGWFRKIVFKHCDRITRRKRVPTTSLNDALASQTTHAGPSQMAQEREMRDSVLEAIQALPEHQRTVTSLFYINGYAQGEIAEFLDVPVTTVKKRLHDSRKRLKERMIHMVADEMKSHPLPEQFPERIRLLLELPRPLEIEGHPVRETWEAFRACVPELEYVEFGEITDAKQSLVLPGEEVTGHTYRIDESRILRPEVTSQMVNHWLNRGGPCALVTTGRVFREVNTGRTHLKAFHQAEILWSGAGFTDSDCDRTMREICAKLLSATEFTTEPFAYGPVPNAKLYRIKLADEWLSIAVVGMVDEETVAKAGLDPEKVGVMSCCFGLERCAMMRHGVDDIRTFFEPPYVPKNS
jgi:RNA polymerase sigma factor (sigma-70 family)